MTHSSSESFPLIALAAGGTGGHLFPAITVARNLMNKGYRTVLITDDRGMRYVKNMPDITVHPVCASPIKPGIWGKIQSAILIGMGYIKSLMILMRDKPHVMVAFGGYPCFPPALAAHHLNIPIALHEQNAVFGRANRVVAKYARKIALSFPSTIHIPDTMMDKTTVTGNPIRPDIVGIGARPYPSIGKKDTINILITGGSQGSRIFGEIIPQAIADLPGDLKQKISITQQCQDDDIARIQKTYEGLDIGGGVKLSTFITNMPEELAKAHLVIARAGASTVAELAVVGRPAIFIPLAISLDADQANNARNMVDSGGGWIIDEKKFTPITLAAQLTPLITYPDQLVTAGNAAKTIARPHAAENLATLIISLIKNG